MRDHPAEPDGADVDHRDGDQGQRGKGDVDGVKSGGHVLVIGVTPAGLSAVAG